MKPKILTDTETKALIHKVILRDAGWCVLCGRPAVDIAHVIPRSHGVKNSAVIWQLKNLASCCRKCHKETRSQRTRFLKKLMELYQYKYDDDPFREYLIGEK